jgi:very-short-patch-repair endonuclease
MITGPVGTVKRARKLRSEMSLPEGLLWRELRERPGRFKFRRQHPAGICVLDFYCPAARLAIEVDGLAHDTAQGVARDVQRSHFLRSQGVATLRVPAKVVLGDIGLVIARILQVCEERRQRGWDLRPVPLPHPADGPPPRSGEE